MTLNLSSKSSLEVHMYLFAFLAPYSVTQWNKAVLLLLLLSALFTLFYSLTLSKKLVSEPYSLKVIVIFLLIFVIALFAIIINRDHLVGNYLREVIVGRLFTLIALSFNLAILHLWLSTAEEKELKRILIIGFSSLLVFIMLGYWQLIGGYLGIPFFVETRDWMHGVPSALRAILPSRVTSIAEEPNFLAPLLIEFILLSLLLLKGKWNKRIIVGATLLILVLSFSGGAYVNLFLIAAMAFCLVALKTVMTSRVKITHFFVLTLFLAFSLAFAYFGTLIFEFIYYKFQHETSGGSSRSQFLVSLTKLLIESDLLQLVFGHGLATMSALNEFGMRSEDYLFRISNNFILDMFWEGGIASVLSILLYYSLLFYPGIKRFHISKWSYIGLLMSMHLVVTSTYRSEYLSTHFTWVIMLILTIYAYEKRTKLSEQSND